jgi:uroporphyrinogen decarboxylase
MHARVDALPRPDPDYHRFLSAIRRENRGRVPPIELAVAPEVVAGLLDEPVPAGDPPAVVRQSVKALHRIGYDVIKVSAPIPFNIPRVHAAQGDGGREWQAQHSGVVQSEADLESFHWPAQNEIDLRPVQVATDALPDGMALVGFSGGVLEFTTDIMGLERFMYAVYDAPDLMAAVFDGVGHTIHQVFELYCQMDSVCALWLGDDLGSRNGLLVSPDLLREHVFPWYRRFADLAHQHDRPFLLHSCGNMYSEMNYLIDEVGIDGKHSFEDAIKPVEQFVAEYGDRVATLGGIDVNLLAQGPESAIAARTREVLATAAASGAYVCGSGNSIPNYVPMEHYLAMLEALAGFNA